MQRITISKSDLIGHQQLGQDVATQQSPTVNGVLKTSMKLKKQKIESDSIKYDFFEELIFDFLRYDLFVEYLYYCLPELHVISPPFLKLKIRADHNQDAKDQPQEYTQEYICILNDFLEPIILDPLFMEIFKYFTKAGTSKHDLLNDLLIKSEFIKFKDKKEYINKIRCFRDYFIHMIHPVYHNRKKTVEMFGQYSYFLAFYFFSSICNELDWLSLYKRGEWAFFLNSFVDYQNLKMFEIFFEFIVILPDWFHFTSRLCTHYKQYQFEMNLNPHIAISKSNPLKFFRQILTTKSFLVEKISIDTILYHDILDFYKLFQRHLFDRDKDLEKAHRFKSLKIIDYLSNKDEKRI